MFAGASAPSGPRRAHVTLGIVVVVSAVILAVVVQRSSPTASHVGAMPTVSSDLSQPGSAPATTSASGSVAPGLPDRLPTEGQAGLSEADGVVPTGVTVFDDRYAAVAKLEPALLAAIRTAAKDAARTGVTFYVDSGWRSAAYQEQLLRGAIAKYGSEAEAARWVATADRSAHVSGDAVDLGHSAATAWLSKRGARYGLCQIYRNEPWHFELRSGASDHGCPAMYADAAHDPRMQR